MWKKMVIFMVVISIFIVSIELFIFSKERKNKESEFMQVEDEKIGRYVTDECISEWKDYSLTIQEEIKETSQNLNDENRHYILKEDNGIVKVFYINESNEEILYKVTDISTKYLGSKDAKELESGIEVEGVTNLNKLLEDFE